MAQVTTTPAQVVLTQRNLQNSPLLRLPAELRNSISIFVLGDCECAVNTPGRSTQQRQGPYRSGQSHHSSRQTQSAQKLPTHFLALLLVCRQLYVETALLPFTLTTFVVTHYEGFEKWIAQTLLHMQRDAIANIKCPLEEVYYAYDERRHCGGFPFRSFKGLDGLKRIVLTGVQWDMIMDGELKRSIGRQFREKSGKDELEVGLSEEVLPDRRQFDVRYWQMRVG